MLEQYSPFLGENFIDYPMLEEYGVPTVEEVPDEGPGDDIDDEDENDPTETEHKDKKELIKHTGRRKNCIQEMRETMVRKQTTL